MAEVEVLTLTFVVFCDDHEKLIACTNADICSFHNHKDSGKKISSILIQYPFSYVYFLSFFFFLETKLIVVFLNFCLTCKQNTFTAWFCAPGIDLGV